MVVMDARGGVSGGTVASGFGAFDDPTARRVAADPYCLNPPDGRCDADCWCRCLGRAVFAHISEHNIS